MIRAMLVRRRGCVAVVEIAALHPEIDDPGRVAEHDDPDKGEDAEAPAPGRATGQARALSVASRAATATHWSHVSCGPPVKPRGLSRRLYSGTAHLVAVLVLVADDDRAVREALERALQLNGFDVALAADGNDALAATSGRPTR